ncbi:MAG TPA: signal recognition particle receptor subunit alpha, partial [Vicinamibacterales bacterium]|nr:signal recognition particle receptor subunit alpha [Vicinamibacterales bacterium]
MSLERGLSKTRGGLLGRLFGALRAAEDAKVTDEWLEQLEEALLRADLSVSLVDPVMLQVRDVVREGRATTVPKVLDAVRDALLAVLAQPAVPPAGEATPRVVLVVGVNGSGKTTTAAKLAKLLGSRGEKPLLAAADTFRAAAIDQLERWAERIGIPIVSGRPDGDPAAVVFDAITAAAARGNTVVIADTAGRLHNKEHLMEELSK